MELEASAHSLYLLNQLNVQREFGFLCDCTVAIGNVFFKAHRAVLAAFSNYFKMIFIHQTSECIKIQPTDIQPDVFSYLLHIMYTGACPKQSVDPGRLTEGIKFLHAFQLTAKTGENANSNNSNDGGRMSNLNDGVRMSNLYGIQISSQLANNSKDPLTPSRPKPPQDQDKASRNVPLSSVASGGDCGFSSHIKQEAEEEEREGDNLCPRCGERLSSPQGLKEHLFSHALEPSHLTDGLEDGLPLDPGCLEEALRQSQALANQLAAELRRSPEGSPTNNNNNNNNTTQTHTHTHTPLPLSHTHTALPPSHTHTALSLSHTHTALPLSHTRRRKMACAVCSLRFSHKSQLQEHMYTHTGASKPSRSHRYAYNRLCTQLLFAAEEREGGGGSEEHTHTDTHADTHTHADTQDNGSSCYSLDSEISQESNADGAPVE